MIKSKHRNVTQSKTMQRRDNGLKNSWEETLIFWKYIHTDQGEINSELPSIRYDHLVMGMGTRDSRRFMHPTVQKNQDPGLSTRTLA